MTDTVKGEMKVSQDEQNFWFELAGASLNPDGAPVEFVPSGPVEFMSSMVYIEFAPPPGYEPRRMFVAEGE